MTVAEEMFEIVRQAMQAQYAEILPTGFSIHMIAEFDPERHRAPNLWLEKREKPAARYLAILISHTSSVPALGETVADAIGSAISKIEARHAAAH
jgi:hypothetical protein